MGVLTLAAVGAIVLGWRMSRFETAPGPKAFNGSAATADEFANVAFSVSFRGYHRAQVDEVLADRLREPAREPDAWHR